MDAKLQDALVRDFPVINRDYGGDPRKTCMAWGYEVGDGWEPLLRRTFEQLSRLDPPPVLAQVKEKYGGLRIYWHGGPDSDVVDDIVDAAEAESYRICEECGKPGEPNTTGWISTRCPGCRAKH
jgi:hypothetical protein